MRRFVTGAVLAGAATLCAVGLAHADTGTVTGTLGDWTYTYDPDDAELVQSPARTEFAWAIPAEFQNSVTGQDLSGTDFFRESEGVGNSEFVVTSGPHDGAIYAIDQNPFPLSPVSSMFYAPNGYDDLTGSDGEIGGLDFGSGGSWLVRPADYSDAVTYSEALDKTDFSGVLNLGAGESATDAWAPTLDSTQPVLGYQDLPMWSGQVTFDDGSNSITGTDYMWSPLGAVGSYDEEFVTPDGATYYSSPGFFGLTDNLYYNPGDGGAITDILNTPLGDVNLSWLSWLFTPPDYPGAVTATPDIPATDLLSALEFGDAAQGAAGAAGDVLGSM